MIGAIRKRDIIAHPFVTGKLLRLARLLPGRDGGARGDLSLDRGPDRRGPPASRYGARRGQAVCRVGIASEADL